MWFIKRQQSQICPKKRKKFHTCKITINLQRETKLDFHCFQTRFSIKNLWVEVLKTGFQLCKKNKGPLRERRSSPYFQHIWDFRQFKTKNWFIWTFQTHVCGNLEFGFSPPFISLPAKWTWVWCAFSFGFKVPFQECESNSQAGLASFRKALKKSHF